MEPDDLKFTNNEDDEIVVVQLPRKDYRTLRKIIDEEKTRGKIIKWILSTAGVISSLMTILWFWKDIPFLK